MDKWILYSENNNDIEGFSISSLLLKVLHNRDVSTKKDIDMILSDNISDIHDESLLINIDKASDIIIDKINHKKSIRIVGDYDIDGICATYILYDFLKREGVDISYYIPNRVSDGYGINKNIIDKCIDDKIDTIITCDNGISAIDEIKYASENNITIVVTDHHEPGEILPEANVIVDPKIKNDAYPFKDICGAVVAWKVVRYIKNKLYKGYDIKNDFTYLEFAAIATIGDIMPIINENHIITKLGLKYIAKTKNKGLMKLLDITNLYNKPLSTYHIGFIIGPMINASGRLEDAAISLRLFLSDDDNEINDIVNHLKKLNDERKKLTEDGVKKAIDIVEKQYKNDKVLTIYLDDTNESVSGIIAGRIKEKYNKPTIILSDTAGDNIVKASGRSIDNYDMYESLYKHKDLYEKFGGHKGAAGFSMKKKHLNTLRDSLNNESKLNNEDFVKNLYIDCEKEVYSIDDTTIKELNKLEPYGHNFEGPIFLCKNVKCIVDKVYGDKRNVIKMTLMKNDKRVKGVLFKNYDEYRKDIKDIDILDIIYVPKLNVYNGYVNIEINIKDYRLSTT